MSQVRVEVGIADHIWQEKRAAIAANIDNLGDKFKPELRAAWLAYILETYPDGPVAATDIIGSSMLEIDEWVCDAVGLSTCWSSVVDETFGKYSTMNTHPNAVSDFWNNKYNSK